MAAVEAFPVEGHRPGLVVWANEEGVRFAPTAMGSGAFADALDSEQRFTVGRLDVEPGSGNTIAGQARVWIDVRHHDEAVLAHAVEAVRAEARRCALPTEVVVVSRAAAVRFDPAFVDAIRRSAARRGLPARTLLSGATHDARHLAAVCPTAMVFVPSIGGISHHPDEATADDDLVAGAEVLRDVLDGLMDPGAESGSA
jgi:N-carbamoyl-L-amino-acid hydrolase